MSISHKQQRQYQPEKLTPPKNLDVELMAALRTDICGSKRNDSEKDDSKKNSFKRNDSERNDNISPLIVEIGAGKGKHALEYAKVNPSKRIIAIERTKNKFEAFAKLALKADLDNLYPIHADAIPLITHMLLPSSVDKIFLLYPNPEPKNPNQQWLNMPFFEFLLSRLRPQGTITLVSNIESYIDNAEAQAEQNWHLACQRIQVPTTSTRTHFEVKYLARGECCWELNMTKPNQYQTRFDNWIARARAYPQAER